MKFSIDVGQMKKHRIEYDFNQLLGRLVIRLNQHEVKRRVRLLNEPVQETDWVKIGLKEAGEPLAVRIERRRRPLLGHKCLVFLNERPFQCY